MKNNFFIVFTTPRAECVKNKSQKVSENPSPKKKYIFMQKKLFVYPDL